MAEETLYECSECHETFEEEFMSVIDPDGTDHICNDCCGNDESEDE